MKELSSTEEQAARLTGDRARLLNLLLEERFRQGQKITRFSRSVDSGGTIKLPSSSPQRQLWFVDRLGGSSSAYHVSSVVRLRGELKCEALERALKTLTNRHEVLRTRFVESEGEVLQEILPESQFELKIFDLGICDDQDREALIRAQVEEEAHTTFDLEVGPLIRGRLLRVRDHEHVLIVTMHHIVSDGWSVGVLSRELIELYGAFREGHADPLKPLPVQYADYAQWQRQLLEAGTLDKQLEYWRTWLKGAPPHIELATDRPRPSVQSYRGRSVPFTLGSQLSGDLKGLARRYGMTMFMVLCAGWGILLARLSGQDDVVIGTPVANRQYAELEGLIGLFVNTLPLRMEVPRNLPLAVYLEKVKELTLFAFNHQAVPFERIVEVLRPRREPGRNPIFQVVLMLLSTPKADMCLPGLSVQSEEGVDDYSMFELMLSLEEQDDEIVGSLRYATDVFDESTVQRWLASYLALLKGMTHNPESRLGKLPMLSESQQSRLIEEFSAQRRTFSEGRLIHQLFEEQVTGRPDAKAVTHDGISLTYAELNKKANQLARYLRDRGVGANGMVGICTERGLEMVVGLLGILKAGGAYLPLDPDYPVDRLRHMVTDAEPKVIVTQEHLRTKLPETLVQVVMLDADWNDIERGSGDNIDTGLSELSAHNLAYVIYTSGSTGRPKGVMIEHGNVTRLFAATKEWFHFDQDDVWTLFHSFAFDFSVWELWGALIHGGRVVLVPYTTVRSPQAFYRLVCEEGVTVLNQTPSAFGGLIDAQAAAPGQRHSLRVIIFGGEALELRALRPWVVRNGAARPLLVNMYGITETTVHVSYCPLAEEQIESELRSPIGRPIPDLSVYLLDPDGQAVPIGVAAEIYVGGAGVARGYLNRPELTAERFVKDPFRADPWAKMYKTGDMGRWRGDGTLEYLGRNDHQVKIRGFRIELGEIEAQLVRHPRVKDAVVVAREDTPAEKRVVAYVIPSSQEPGTLSPEMLRAHVKLTLPDYMVPSAFVSLSSIPLTPNGKLDRAALPVPEVPAYATRPFDAPQGEVEQLIAGIWQELLRSGKVGRQDNFFELGGHSLLALKVLHKANQHFSARLNVTDLYRNPTLRELAAHVCGRATVDPLVNLSQEATLSSEIVAADTGQCVSAGSVLLTGCTGFVGRFLLAQLLHDTDATIYCLVRAGSSNEAKLRVERTLSKWGLWREEFANRIAVVAGDLSSPGFGIDEGAYWRLAGEIDRIYHCATSMNHLETYAMAKKTNVEAARDVIKFATCRRPKSINYLSTLSVFGPSAGPAIRVINEGSAIDQEKHPSSKGYVASKWVAEKMFMTASDRGIRCNIFRLGLIWADTVQGRYDEMQREHRIFKTCLISGYGIENYRYTLAPTPVDYAVRAVVFLAERRRVVSGIFHISSADTRIPKGLFEICNDIRTTSIELIPLYKWICEIKRLYFNGQSLPAVPLVEFAFSMDEESFLDHQARIGFENTRFDFTRTHDELEGAGIVAPVLDRDLLKVYLRGMFAGDDKSRLRDVRRAR